MDFELRILGSGSATPVPGRHHTAQVLSVGNMLYLLDCGEGTQRRLMEHKLSPLRLNVIFISHLHGDHFFGLFGLLGTMQLQSRTEPLRLFGPAGLEEVLTTQFRHSSTQLSFDLEFVVVDPTVHQLVYEDKLLTVHSLPMRHRIACCGYLLREQPRRRPLLRERLPAGLTPPQFQLLSQGEDLLDEATGNVLVRYAEVTGPPKRARSYAFCSDTVYLPELAELVRGVDVLYHEATFLDELRERAAVTFHATARQAGQLAREAGVGQLLIGHFSSRYRDLEPHLREARTEFARTLLALEGTVVNVPNLPAAE
ncbi:ribonuclease Z [Hymenobacter guriensis]|uniref:Ribonuclease Z n=1 Tax=Hymenobacter guriensis TaxID=2793065 RepID=A0ABS0L693_9BACT|nr:ribonuclease Z [Hymenobacter guriensis]MBG8555668.1 ribonuclease Z [Hymenobacter guriensis]